MQRQPSEGFFKKSVMRDFAYFTNKKLCGAAASLGASLSRSGFLAGFARYAGICEIGGICAIYCYNHKQPSGGVLQKRILFCRTPPDGCL